MNDISTWENEGGNGNMKKTILTPELDDIYDTIDLLMRNGKWDFLDDNFRMWKEQAWRTDPDKLLTYATASFPGKSKIPLRNAFIEKCQKLYPSPDGGKYWNE